MEYFIILITIVVIIALLRIQTAARKSKRTRVIRNKSSENETGSYFWFPGDSGGAMEQEVSTEEMLMEAAGIQPVFDEETSL